MITIKIPATSANLGSGFDSLGLAVDLYNTIKVEKNGGDEILFQIFGEGEGVLPSGRENIIYQAMEAVFNRVGIFPNGYTVSLQNGIPLSRGLGSSAAAIVGGLVLGNYLTGEQLSADDLLKMATAIEGHPDNVAPALFGGLVVSAMQGADVVYLRLEPPQGLQAIVAIPDFHLSTEKARQVLPKQVCFGDAVFNLSRVALLVGAFAANRLDLLAIGTEDKLHQAYRCSLVPGMAAVFAAAKQAGAKAAAISGAGPSILALAAEHTEEIAQAMRDAFLEAGIKSEVRILDLCLDGYQVVKK